VSSLGLWLELLGTMPKPFIFNQVGGGGIVHKKHCHIILYTYIQALPYRHSIFLSFFAIVRSLNALIETLYYNA
jgi:hypothetical protein